MHIWRVTLIPSTIYDAGVPATKNRVYTLGVDQVTDIQNEGTEGDLVITFEDEQEDDNGTPVIVHRNVLVPFHQIRLIYRSDEGE